LGEGVLSTWELPVIEIVSSGTDRIIVYEGAEEKLKQLGTGLLEKLGIGGSSWEQEERERFRAGLVPAENQLPAGQPSAVESQRRLEPARAQAFQPESELDYVELEERRSREPLRQRRYLDEDAEPRRAAWDPEPRYPDDEPRYSREEPRYRDDRDFEALPRREPPPAPRAERTIDGRRSEARGSQRPIEPIDVDPEVLDDPW
jgi:hypothetical protein